MPRERAKATWSALKEAISRIGGTHLYLSEVVLPHSIYRTGHTSAAQRYMRRRSDPNLVVGEEDGHSHDNAGSVSL